MEDEDVAARVNPSRVVEVRAEHRVVARLARRSRATVDNDPVERARAHQMIEFDRTASMETQGGPFDRGVLAPPRHNRRGAQAVGAAERDADLALRDPRRRRMLDRAEANEAVEHGQRVDPGIDPARMEHSGSSLERSTVRVLETTARALYRPELIDAVCEPEDFRCKCVVEERAEVDTASPRRVVKLLNVVHPQRDRLLTHERRKHTSVLEQGFADCDMGRSRGRYDDEIDDRQLLDVPNDASRVREVGEPTAERLNGGNDLNVRAVAKSAKRHTRGGAKADDRETRSVPCRISVGRG